MQVQWKIFVSLSFVLLFLNLLNFVRLRKSTKLSYRTYLSIHKSGSENLQLNSGTQGQNHKEAYEGSVFNTSQGRRDKKDKVTYTERKNSDDEIILIKQFLKQNALRCPTNRRPSPDQIAYSSDEQLWQRLDFRHLDRHERLYTYSAHTDPRPVGTGCRTLPSLRLFSVLSHRKPFSESFECHIWYEGVDEPFVSLAVTNETGMNIYDYRLNLEDPPKIIKGGKEIPKGQRSLDFFEFTLSCPLLTEFPRPSHVSIFVATDNCTGQYTTFIPVEYRPRAKPQHEFGVCVTNGYNGPSLNVFVEWVELHRMLGVSEITLYDTDFTSEMIKSFQHYRQQGVLTVRRLPHPVQSQKVLESPNRIHMIRNLRTTAINDCVLRAAYRYRWVIIVDLDEIIIPRHHFNYSSLLEEIDRRFNKTPESYLFRNIYYLNDFPPDNSRSELLKTMRQRYRALPSPPYTAPKSISDPIKCWNMFNHYCLKPLTPRAERRNDGGLDYRIDAIEVPASVAGSHHYRQCGKFYGTNCTQLLSEKVLDNTMLRFERELTVRVKSAVDSITEHNKASLGLRVLGHWFKL